MDSKNSPSSSAVTYEPKTAFSNPRMLANKMLKDLLISRDLAWRLFVRDLTARYRQSLLGIGLAFIPPLATALIFIFLQFSNIINFNEDHIPYAAFAIIGTSLWQIFVDSLNSPMKSVLAAKPMLTKINFPKEALILSCLYDNIFNALIKFCIIFCTLLFFNINLSMVALFSAFSIFFLIIFGLSLGMIVTPLGILYTDISIGLTLFSQLLFFLTPVVYQPPPNLLFSFLSKINPVSPLLTSTRELIIGSNLSHPLEFTCTCIFTVLFSFVSWIFFRIAIPVIVERISS